MDSAINHCWQERYCRGAGLTHVRAVPIPEVCRSPHTAGVVGDHVAALVAAECFGKFWEILKGAQYPVKQKEEIVGCCYT